MGIAHTHSSLVDVESLLFQIAELESGHDVVISLLGIEILSTWFVGGERSDTVYETLLYEVVTQIHVVVLTYSQCYVDRAYPVALSYHFQHHQVALVECILSGE